jgi:transketolase N-terminal domain/subunit
MAVILAVLYFGRTYDYETDSWNPILRYDPLDPLLQERDRIILSKGQAVPAFYSALAEAGFFSRDL